MKKSIIIEGKSFVYDEEVLTYDHAPIEEEDAAKILTFAKKMFVSRGLSFFLFWGTLLGAVREHSVIKGDDDIDIATLDEDGLKKSLPFFYEQGFKVIRIVPGQLYSFRIDETCFIDVYIVKKLKSRLSLWYSWCYNICGHILPKKYFTKMNAIRFLGVDCLIPNNPEKVLTILYGKTWRIPQKGAKSMGEVRSAYYFHNIYPFVKTLLLSFIAWPYLRVLLFNSFDGNVEKSVDAWKEYKILSKEKIKKVLKK